MIPLRYPGDATLEGAVYGLFAADDIYGPDTQRDENGNVSSELAWYLMLMILLPWQPQIKMERVPS